MLHGAHSELLSHRFYLISSFFIDTYILLTKYIFFIILTIILVCPKLPALQAALHSIGTGCSSNRRGEECSISCNILYCPQGHLQTRRDKGVSNCQIISGREFHWFYSRARWKELQGRSGTFRVGHSETRGEWFYRWKAGAKGQGTNGG